MDLLNNLWLALFAVVIGFILVYLLVPPARLEDFLGITRRRQRRKADQWSETIFAALKAGQSDKQIAQMSPPYVAFNNQSLAHHRAKKIWQDARTRDFDAYQGIATANTLQDNVERVLRDDTPANREWLSHDIDVARWNLHNWRSEGDLLKTSLGVLLHRLLTEMETTGAKADLKLVLKLVGGQPSVYSQIIGEQFVYPLWWNDAVARLRRKPKLELFDSTVLLEQPGSLQQIVAAAIDRGPSLAEAKIFQALARSNRAAKKKIGSYLLGRLALEVARLHREQHLFQDHPTTSVVPTA